MTTGTALSDFANRLDSNRGDTEPAGKLLSTGFDRLKDRAERLIEAMRLSSLEVASGCGVFGGREFRHDGSRARPLCWAGCGASTASIAHVIAIHWTKFRRTVLARAASGSGATPNMGGSSSRPPKKKRAPLASRGSNNAWLRSAVSARDLVGQKPSDNSFPRGFRCPRGWSSRFGSLIVSAVVIKTAPDRVAEIVMAQLRHSAGRAHGALKPLGKVGNIMERSVIYPPRPLLDQNMNCACPNICC